MAKQLVPLDEDNDVGAEVTLALICSVLCRPWSATRTLEIIDNLDSCNEPLEWRCNAM